MSKPEISVLHNPYFNARKSAQQTDLLRGAAESLGIPVAFVRSDDVDASVGSVRSRPLARKILFLDKNVALARSLAASGHALYNCPDAIETCDNKAYTHARLLKADVPQPDTLVGPMTYGLGEISPDSGFVRQIEAELGYPVVVKEVYGSFGKQVYLAGDARELAKILRETNGRQVVAQRFMGERPGQSVRAIVVAGRVVGALRQANPRDFRSNLTQGSAGEACKLSPPHEALALRAAKALNLFYGGIDWLYAGGGLVFCEANSNAQLAAASAALNANLGEALLRAIHEDKTYGG